MMLKLISASIAFFGLVNPALAVGNCAANADALALKTAVMNQELMVAAFQCNEAGAYNRFVTTYKSELRSSDAVLKAYFVRSKQGEAGYDTFKTKAANLSALQQARHSAAFCADAHALFTAVFAHQGSLISFVESRSDAIDIGGTCVEPRPAPPILASFNVRPQRATQIEVIGVPAHSLPAMDYRRDIAATVSPSEASKKDSLPPQTKYLPPLDPPVEKRIDAKSSPRPAKTSYRIGDYRPSVETVVNNSEIHTIDNLASTAVAITPRPFLPNSIGENASRCLKVDSDGNHLGFRNSCDFAVQFAYCTVDDGNSLTACTGNGTVSAGVTGSVAPSGFGALVADTGMRDKNASHKFRWIACGGGSGEVVAHLVTAEPPAGRCERSRTAAN